MQAHRQAVYIRPIILRAVSQSSVLFKSIENRFGGLFQSIILDRIALVVYSSQVCQADLTRKDNQSLFWSSMLDRLSLQFYFSQFYILDLIVNFSRVFLERLTSRVQILFQSTISRERDRDLLCLSVFQAYTLASRVYFSRVYNQKQTGRQTGRYTVTIDPICISRV